MAGRLAVVLLVLSGTGCGLKADVPQQTERLAVADAASPSAEPSAVSAPFPSSSRPSPSPSPAPSPRPAPEPTSVPPPTTSPPPPPRTAAALVGRWHVDGRGVADGTALVLGEDLALFLPCGVLDGAWEADGPQGLFIASTYGGDSSCFTGPGRPAPAWLEQARGFDLDGEQRVLRDGTGAVVARLRPGARPSAGPNRSSAAAAEPQVTPRLRARWADPAPLPRGATAVTRDQLQRRWVPVEEHRTQPELVFGADGEYSGSDGCNGQGGRYVLGGEGRLLATGAPSTAAGCDGAPVGAWADAAARAGLVDGDLVLYGPAAEVLGRLRPA